ncbi:hypothetical protein [Streptomyces sp. ME19-01-6]|uniref:hypothetical protein n=1 Tax=Streptomyces sp. ME19-01-6 TaxID=3028686 RepID=UPI0029A43032|nr:hypothetical protein [Streptomyces sp. ME19-01-6]MDX3231720.1 hypothetical protein [Streptomyces sp. ME19-01-6]
MRTRRSQKEPPDRYGPLAVAHGAFNVVGGLWPLVHLRSFEWVFGSKRERWLQHTVGGLLVANGVSQLAGAGSADRRASARTTGLTTALTLLAVDLAYVPKGRIRPTYLLDAVMEAGWITAWLRARQREGAGRARAPGS